MERCLPDFRSNKAFGIAQGVKAFLHPESSNSRNAPPDAAHREERARESEEGQTTHVRTKKKIKDKKRELARIKEELRTSADRAEVSEHRSRKKRVQQEIFELERRLHVAEGEKPGTGALPDFVIIGGKKCGTTFLYHLLAQHPLVEPAAKKELHFFDNRFDEGVEWYRRCFPQPRLKDGRWIITGEATPYLAHPSAAERMAQVIPQARLILLLRNPVDRTFSEYQMRARKGRETRSFEEAVEAEEALLRIGRDKILEDKHYYVSLGHQLSWYLFKSIYVDQLLRWLKLFSQEQMLVLKSEDFFESPHDTLGVVLEFLGLPDWEPDASELRNRRNTGGYEGRMHPATRRRLEEYFEPHNKRLYEHLGVDFGW
jgi:Sulfotransferase domain